jgi:hypothetical protein
LLGVLILLAAAPLNAPMPLVDAESIKSPAEFSACFTRGEDYSGRAWAFMPSAHGGTFTDSGARGGPASYWLQVRAAGGATHLRLFTAGGSQPASRAIEAVEQCR